MAIFYKHIYLIINALINTVVKDCSEIPFTVGSGRIEASELAGFCTIMVLSERYFRSLHSSKVLLLSNYFIFFNMLELAIFSDHCPTFMFV